MFDAGSHVIAEAAQVAAHADHAVERHVYQRALIETVAREWLLGLALRAMVRTVAVRIGDRFRILLDGAGERV